MKIAQINTDYGKIIPTSGKLNSTLEKLGILRGYMSDARPRLVEIVATEEQLDVGLQHRVRVLHNVLDQQFVLYLVLRASVDVNQDHVLPVLLLLLIADIKQILNVKVVFQCLILKELVEIMKHMESRTLKIQNTDSQAHTT